MMHCFPHMIVPFVLLRNYMLLLCPQAMLPATHPFINKAASLRKTALIRNSLLCSNSLSNTTPQCILNTISVCPYLLMRSRLLNTLITHVQTHVIPSYRHCHIVESVERRERVRLWNSEWLNPLFARILLLFARVQDMLNVVFVAGHG